MTTRPILPSPTDPNALSVDVTSGHVTIGSLPAMQQLPTLRDPEWLKLEVCREYQRGACSRTAEECKYAHPARNLQIMADGKVIACFDALKGRCSRESCKYLHPPNHLKQQLEINGRNNLIQQRAMLSMMPQTVLQAPQPAVNQTPPIVQGLPQFTHTGNQMYSQTAPLSSTPSYTLLPTGEIAINSPLFYFANPQPTNQQLQIHNNAHISAPISNITRADRLEACRDYQRGNCTRGPHECRFAHPPDRNMIDPNDNKVTVCMDCIKGRCVRDKCKYFHPPPHLQAKIRASQHQSQYLPTSILASTQTNIGHSLKRPLDADLANSSVSTALGQPPHKSRAIDMKGVSASTSATNATPALYSYAFPVQQQQQQQQQAAAAYYQVPFLSMYNGSSGMSSAQTALSATNGQTNVSNALALLNGQNQILLK